jgi:uncharacterized membrane protein
MEFITTALGRFHPLIVHLPIGILLLAFIFECLSLTGKYRKLRSAVQPSLFLGAGFALLATITGYFLKQEGGYEEKLVTVHQYFGIATTAFAIFLFFIRSKLKAFYSDSVRRRKAKVILFLPLVILVAATGHWGGSLTHGEAFLSGAFYQDSGADPLVAIKNISDPYRAVLFRDVVKPILQARCYSCHSATKQKGKLRLDSEEFILKGGKNGIIVTAGLPDSSELFKRLILPIDDDHHMPPREKPQLSSTEADIIKTWIAGGGNFSQPVAAYAEANKISQLIYSIQYVSEESWVPDQPVSEADPKVVAGLQSAGAIVLPVASGSNYLMANFLNMKEIPSGTLQLLNSLQTQVLWLNLGGTSVTDEDLGSIARLENLRVLYLNDTDITDRGISYLKPSKKLIYLNLVDTRVTDLALEQLKEFDKLKKLFVFDTSITRDGLQKFLNQKKQISVDTGGYQLESLPGDTIVYKRKI